VTRQIAAFSAKYPKVSVLVTSRIVGYSRKTLADAGFTHITLQDLGTEQISDFLTGWYALALHDRPADAAIRKDRLLAAIAESRPIGEMAGNPLLLTILAIIGRHQELPRERWKVYDYAATVLVERWDVNRHLRDEHLPIGFIGEDDKKELLRHISLLMQTGTAHGGNYLTGEELRREFESYLQARFRRDPSDAASIAQAMIRQFRERNFILSRYGGELYGFVHRAFLEFFCAEAFRWQFERDRTIDLDYLKFEVFGKHWSDPSWREVLRLIAGTIRERWMAEIVTFLVDEINLPWPWQFKDRLPLNIALAAQCLAESRTVAELDHAAARVLVRVIQLLEHSILDTDSPSVALLNSEIIPAIAAIGQAWPHRDIYLRWYMARGVKLAWTPISEQAARIAICLFPREPELRDAFIASLRATGDARFSVPVLRIVADYSPSDPDVRGLLLDRASGDEDWQVRLSAVQALAATPGGDPDVRTLLLDRAANDEDRRVRLSSVRALAAAAISDPDVRALLVDSLARDQNQQIRLSAVQALAGVAADPGVRNQLQACTARDEDWQVSLSAKRALAGAAATSGARARLLERAANDKDWQIRLSAVRALATAASTPDVIAVLLERAVTDADRRIRRSAIRIAAAQLATPEIRSVLVDRAASDEDWQVRLSAVEALAAEPDTLEIRVLLLDRAANDENQQIRHSAGRALLIEPGTPEIQALFLDRAANDSDVDVRRSAVRALNVAAATAEVRAQLLDSAADDEDWQVRLSAVETLAAHPDDVEVRALLLDRAADDEDWQVRLSAVEALAAHAGDRHIHALLVNRAVNDSDVDVRLSAVQALAVSAEEPAVRSLLLDRAANDPDVDIRLSAVQALAASAANAEIRALLLDRATDDGRLDVSFSDWPQILSGNLEDPAVQFIIAGGADEFDQNWIRQLTVRIASCSAKFDPSALPSIGYGQGNLLGDVW
jgi:HEAT repeat protein